MQAPEWLPQYAATGAAALIGSLARGRSWRGPDGRVHVVLIVPELVTAIALSIGVMALGSYGHVDMKILAGLAVFAGWLGPAAVSDLVMAKIRGTNK